jgi:hypothetical protein
MHTALVSWVSFDAPVGHEARTTVALGRVLSATSGATWKVDAWGNLVLRKGSGLPRRVVAGATDRGAVPAVSAIANGHFAPQHRK